MTKEELRYHVLSGIDRMLSHPVILGLDDTDRAILHAQRRLYESNDAVLDSLFSLVQNWRIPQ